jgi:hypothetical protein
MRCKALFSGTDHSSQDVDRIIEKYNPKINVPAAFSLPFEVPYKNGTRDLTGLTSKSSFDEFLLAAASKMETRITMLSSIGYVPSYKKPKPQPKLLDDEDAWEVLVSDVRQHIKGAQSKNRGKGQVQPFSILISDMSESGSEPSKGGKKVCTFDKQGGRIFTNCLTQGVKKSKSNEDSLDTAGPAVKEHELFKQIETKHYCQSCKAPCVVLDSGDHHILTNTELATWALLLVSPLRYFKSLCSYFFHRVAIRRSSEKLRRSSTSKLATLGSSGPRITEAKQLQAPMILLSDGYKLWPLFSEPS